MDPKVLLAVYAKISQTYKDKEGRRFLSFPYLSYYSFDPDLLTQIGKDTGQMTAKSLQMMNDFSRHVNVPVKSSVYNSSSELYLWDVYSDIVNGAVVATGPESGAENRKEYEEAMTKYDSSQLQYNYPVVTDRLGSTVKLNEDNSISLINPGNDDMANLQKESTGIMTRVGFTYGKFRGKIKFPVMLNEENIWNGLTYAFWLIYQDEHAWNNRRTSTKGGGYIDKNDDSENPVRHHDYHYSEIDIEIVKASRYWPKMYYDEKDTQHTAYVRDAAEHCWLQHARACRSGREHHRSRHRGSDADRREHDHSCCHNYTCRK